MNRIGRTLPGTPVRPSGITTASAYSAYDAVGSAFQLPMAAGIDGGILSQLMAYDRGTANAALRVHLFSTAFSASQDGVTFQVSPADYQSGIHLGWIDIQTTDWVTGGTAQNMARVTGQPIGLNSMSGARIVHAQMQCINAPTFGATANPITLMPVVSQD